MATPGVNNAIIPLSYNDWDKSFLEQYHPDGDRQSEEYREN